MCPVATWRQTGRMGTALPSRHTQTLTHTHTHTCRCSHTHAHTHAHTHTITHLHSSKCPHAHRWKPSHLHTHLRAVPMFVTVPTVLNLPHCILPDSQLSAFPRRLESISIPRGNFWRWEGEKLHVCFWVGMCVCARVCVYVRACMCMSKGKTV